ncbi:MAG: hypothetical protein ACRBCL_04610 [Maritimibacter sp.]
MTNNIVAFDSARRKNKSAAKPGQKIRDNIVSLAQWASRPHPHRTPNGVFFMTQVLSTPGDVA